MSIAKSEPAAFAVSLVLSKRIVSLAEFQLRQLALSQLGFAGELADAALEFYDRLVEAVFVRLEICSRTEASLWKRRDERNACQWAVEGIHLVDAVRRARSERHRAGATQFTGNR